MKPFIISLLGCIFSCLPGIIFSQSIALGVNGGVSIPHLRSSGDNEISKDYASRLAANFGVFADFGITEKFSVKTDIQYSGQGGKRQGMQPVTNIPAALAQQIPPGMMLYANFNNQSVLNYLDIPVMTKYSWGNKLKYYLNAGPYCGILLSARQKTDGNSQLFFDKGGTQPLSIQGQPLPAQSFNANTDIKKDINPVNFGITGGVGLGYALGASGEIDLDVRAAYGLTTIQKDTQTNGKSHTGDLFLTLGYAYVLHR